MKFFNNKAQDIWVKHIVSNYEIIDVEAGACRCNRRCHQNSVHEALRNKHEKIAVVIYIDCGEPVLHFVNYDGKKYVDNTLGEWSRFNEHYFVRWITKDQFNNIVFDIFAEIRERYTAMIPWWYRKFVSITI